MNRKLLGVYYFFYYQAIAALLPYLPLYLANRGLNSGQIGLVLAIGPFVMIFSQPFWGMWADRIEAPKIVIIFTILLSVLTIWGYYLSSSFWLISLAAIIFFFFQSPITPISDSLILANLGKNSSNFGLYRLWGSIGFAIGVVIMGKLLEYLAVSLIFLYYVLALVLALIVLVFIPDRAKLNETKLNVSLNFIKIISNRKLLNFLIFGFVVQTSFGANNSFFSLYFKQLGGNTGVLGWAWALAALSEVPIFFMAKNALHKFAHQNLLSFAALIYGLRWMTHYLITTPNLLLVTSLTQGLTFGIFYFTAVDFINSNTPKQLKTTGQTIFGAICFGFGPMLGSLLAGWLANLFSFELMYGFYGFICLIAAIVYYKLSKGENYKKTKFHK